MDTYERAFLVHADNVGSKQFMDIRAVSWAPPRETDLPTNLLGGGGGGNRLWLNRGPLRCTCRPSATTPRS